MIRLNGGRGRGEKFGSPSGGEDVIEAAPARSVSGGESGRGPCRQVEVSEGINEEWLVADHQPPKPWSFVVRLEVCPVQLRANQADGVPPVNGTCGGFACAFFLLNTSIRFMQGLQS